MFERGKREGDTTGAAESKGPSGWGGRDVTAQATGSEPRSGDGAAVIGRSIRINGDLRGEEDLRIEGDVSGTVELKKGNLTIGNEGRVRADVYAKSITVDGTMEGDLYAAERVAIRAQAQVRGNVTAPRVAIEEGASFKGSIEMDQTAVDRALGKGSSTPAKPAAVESAPKKTGVSAAAAEPKEAAASS